MDDGGSDPDGNSAFFFYKMDGNKHNLRYPPGPAGYAFLCLFGRFYRRN